MRWGWGLYCSLIWRKWYCIIHLIPNTVCLRFSPISSLIQSWAFPTRHLRVPLWAKYSEEIRLFWHAWADEGANKQEVIGGDVVTRDHVTSITFGDLQQWVTTELNYSQLFDCGNYQREWKDRRQHSPLWFFHQNRRAAYCHLQLPWIIQLIYRHWSPARIQWFIVPILLISFGEKLSQSLFFIWTFHRKTCCKASVLTRCPNS